ncbi:13219_t:CDS:10 [Rhizophagus irregularis]|nr:13219_t:CDS:10 [Rhizophagus irregularis]
MNKESSTYSKSSIGDSSFVSIKSELTKLGSSLKLGRSSKSPANDSRPTSPPQSSSNSRRNNKSNRTNNKNGHNQQFKLNNDIGSLPAAILSSKANNINNTSRHKSSTRNKIVSPRINNNSNPNSRIISPNNSNPNSRIISPNNSNPNSRIMSPNKVLSPIRGVNGGGHSRIPSVSTLSSGSGDDDDTTSSSSDSESDSEDSLSDDESDNDDIDSNSDTADIYIPTRPPNLLRNKKSTTDLSPISTNVTSSNKSNVKSKSVQSPVMQSPIQQQSLGSITSPTSFTAAGVSLSRELSQKKLLNKNKGNHNNSSSTKQLTQDSNTLSSRDDRDKKLRSRNEKQKEYLVDKINPSREIQQGQSSSNTKSSRNGEKERETSIETVQKSKEKSSDEYRDNQKNNRHRAYKDRDDHDVKERTKFDNDRKHRNNYDPDLNNEQSLYNKSSRKNYDDKKDSLVRAKSLTSGYFNDNESQNRRSHRTKEKSTTMVRTRSKSLEGRSTDVNKDSLRDKEYEKLMERSQNQSMRSGNENVDKINTDKKRGARSKFELENDPKLLINQISNKQKNDEPHIEKDEPKSSSGKITTQFFIEESKEYKSITLTPEMTALEVMNIFRSNNTISDAGAWTIFEVNSLVLRKYAHRNALTLAGFNERTPLVSGALYILDIKKNKWQKRFVQIKDGSLYHSKDYKGTNETFLCSMVSFDVYVCMKTFKTFPTNFVFAIKSQDKITMFENPENDYMHYLCADHLEKMNEWIIAVRMAKNKIMRETSPELFIDIPVKNEKPNAPINLSIPLTNALPATVSETTSLMNEITFELASFSTTKQSSTDTSRRHVRSSSTGSLLDNPPGTISLPAENIKKKSSFEDSKKKAIRKMNSFHHSKTNAPSNDGVFKGGSLLDYDEKNPPVKPVEPEQVTFVKGVGIIRDSNNGPLLSLEGDVKFHKGSLLDRNAEGGGSKALQRNKTLRQNQQNQPLRQNNFQPLLRFGNDQKGFSDGIKSPPIKSPPVKPHDGERDGYF